MRAVSIRVQLLAFGMASAVGSMGLGFAITLALPPPERGRTNIAEMAWALSGRRSSVVATSIRAEPPTGSRSDLVERAVAVSLRAAAADVRAVWIDLPGGSSGRGQAVLRIDRRDVLVDATKRGFQLRYGDWAVLDDGTLLPLFTAAVRLPDGRWRWAVPDDPARDAWTRRIALSFLVALAIILPLAALVAHRLGRPLKLLGRAAAAATSDVSDPFPVSGPSELRATAEAMNAMHGRLRTQAAERITMLGGLAHDLRTPLTALRLRSEALPASMRAVFLADIDRMTGLTDAMLGSALVGAYVPVIAPTDLTALVRDCADLPCTGDAVRFGQMEQVVVDTDAILARRLIGNLLENAVLHGVDASISVVARDNGATVIVSDSGPGIPPDLLASATRPFVRLTPEAKQSGTGLGLSIATEIAKVLDVGFTMSDARPGLQIVLRF